MVAEAKQAVWEEPKQEAVAEPRQEPTPDERTKVRTIRMTIDLSPKFYEQLVELEKMTYLGNKATVIRHALTVYYKLVTTVRDGGEVRLTKDDHVSYLDEESTPDRRTKVPTTRMTIDLSPKFYEQLAELEKMTSLGNKATVIRHALLVYYKLVTTVRDGGEVRLTKDNYVSYLDDVALAVA